MDRCIGARLTLVQHRFQFARNCEHSRQSLIQLIQSYSVWSGDDDNYDDADVITVAQVDVITSWRFLSSVLLFVLWRLDVVIICHPFPSSVAPTSWPPTAEAEAGAERYARCGWRLTRDRLVLHLYQVYNLHYLRRPRLSSSLSSSSSLLFSSAAIVFYIDISVSINILLIIYLSLSIEFI